MSGAGLPATPAVIFQEPGSSKGIPCEGEGGHCLRTDDKIVVLGINEHNLSFFSHQCYHFCQLRHLPNQQRNKVQQMFLALVTGDTPAATLIPGGIVALRDELMAGLPRAKRMRLLPGD